MSTRSRLEYDRLAWLPALLLCWPALGSAQVPVDESGNPIGEYAPVAAEAYTGNEDIPLLSAAELEELVGPIALYPDDLLAVVLPASAYPLQIVQAGRFLEALEDDPSLQPDESWDDSVVALTNYPEVVKLLNDDLDWTWRLGEAVVAQQADVIAAVESFRDRAYAAGNLKSDEHQTISQNDGYIEITPVDDDVIYVPYYEPERVVVYQPRPVYHYYPQPCPVYYYPYPSHYSFHRGYFWGVRTAFSLGFHTNRLHVFHHSYRGHPYYGRYYWPRWWWRQPTLNVYNHIYVRNNLRRSRNYVRSGDYWRPNVRRTVSFSDRRVTRTRSYPRNETRTNTRSAPATFSRSQASRADLARREDARSSIRFRDRPEANNRPSNNRRATTLTRPSSGDRSRRSTRAVPERSTREPARRTSLVRPSTQRQASQRPPKETRPRLTRQPPTRQNVSRQSTSRQLRANAPRRSLARPSQSRGKQPRVGARQPNQVKQVRQVRQTQSKPAAKSNKTAKAARKDNTSRLSRRR